MTGKMYSSVSSLDLYERCPNQYKVWKIERREPPFSQALETGTNVHAQIAAHLHGEPVADPHQAFLTFAASRFNTEALAIEHRFTAELDPCFLVGRIDAVFSTNGPIEVADWKSGSGGWAEYDNLLQLPLYCIALATIWDRPITNFRYSYVSLQSGHEFSRIMTPERAAHLTHRVETILTGLQAAAYDRRCETCWACRGEYSIG